MPTLHHAHILYGLWLISSAFLLQSRTAAFDFNEQILPILEQRCVSCHNADELQGELDLSGWREQSAVRQNVERLDQIRWQITNNEMPPEDAPALTATEREKLLGWIEETEHQIAQERAGDPGPVILRRLSNHEYNYTVQDLTGIQSLEPARDFPVDGAAGEGFTNVGSALVMSPGLLNKYLDAAKQIASHAVFLPNRMKFSSSTSRADWTQESLDAIRDIYARYATGGQSSAQNLQGVQFSTIDAAVIPLAPYLRALITSSNTSSNASEDKSESNSHGAAAQQPRLSDRYLERLREAVSQSNPSVLIAELQSRLQSASDGNVQSLSDWIQSWQGALWYFGKVGHIGKRDGPVKWQNAILPIATQQRFDLPLTPATDSSEDVTLRLVAHDAGDGSEGDTVLWKDALIRVDDKTVIPLNRLDETIELATQLADQHLGKTDEYLRLAFSDIAKDTEQLDDAAAQKGLNPTIADEWRRIAREFKGIKTPSGHLSDKISNVGGYDAIRGWGRELPTLLTNRSSSDLSFSTLRVPARGVTVHPTPEIDSIVTWQSPVSGIMHLSGSIADMDAVCGNGVTWSLTWFHELGSTELAEGTVSNGANDRFNLPDPIEVQQGDLIQFAIKPGNRDHSCDTTQISLTIQSTKQESQVWDLATDIVDRIHEGNPLADRLGHADVWHFCKSSGTKTPPSLISPQSTLAQFMRAMRDNEQADASLVSASITNPVSAADLATAESIRSLSGPFPWLDLALSQINKTARASIINQTAPSVIEFNIPAEIARSAAFSATTELAPLTEPANESDGNGSVQIEVTLSDIEASSRLLPGTVIAASTAPGTAWTAGQPSMVSDRPILVRAGSAAEKKMTQAITDFQMLFPAALCYSRIVPVDEVVTLTLRYREDEQLQNLMLSDAEKLELDQHWSDLWFVSRHANKQKDAFDQLWQYATQDADPSAFEPMRLPIQTTAKDFNESLLAAEPIQLQAVIASAPRFWRRPLTDQENQQLTKLYHQFRTQGLDHESALRQLIARILVAPEFLYRVEETDPSNGQMIASQAAHNLSGSIKRITDWELASRLSYFLWSSCPDQELDALAAEGKLRQPDHLAMQVRRMLRDPKVRRLATEFGCQWLGVRNVATSDEKSQRHFPTFLEIRDDMQEEVTRFWIHLLQHKKSPLELIASDVTFVNGSLAQHYGFAQQYGIDEQNPEWHLIKNLGEKGRGGILGFAASLTQQSGASRTSPILRGHWISETLLGEKLPKPPKDVPVLPETPPEGLTERELIERHSSDPNCSRCHERIDPYGFALESFDAIGRFRENQVTDATLPDGTKISGLVDLQRYLITKRRDDFLRQFSRKLLGYALGRSVQLSDRPLLDQINEGLRSTETNSIEDAIIMVVQSTQFNHLRLPPTTTTISRQDTSQ